MNKTAVDFKDILIAVNGALYQFGVNVFVDFEPEKDPNEIIAIHDTSGGSGPDNTTGGYFNNTVMIRIRGEVENEVATYELAQTIRNIFHRKTKATVNGTVYHHILAMGDIQVLGRDEMNRPLYSINFDVHRSH